MKGVYFYVQTAKATTPEYQEDLKRFTELVGEPLGHTLPYRKFGDHCPEVPDDRGQSYGRAIRRFFQENRAATAQ